MIFELEKKTLCLTCYKGWHCFKNNNNRTENQLETAKKNSKKLKKMFHLRLGPQSLGVYLKSRKINIILEFIVAANRLLELLSDDRKCTMSLKKIMAEFISRCLVKVISFLSRGRWGTYGQHFSIFNIVQNWNVFKSWPEMWHIFLKLLFVVY
jgi:hypothetical protein